MPLGFLYFSLWLYRDLQAAPEGTVACFGSHLRSLGTSHLTELTKLTGLTRPKYLLVSCFFLEARSLDMADDTNSSLSTRLAHPPPPLLLSPTEYASTPPGPKVSSSGPGLGQLSMYFGCLRL